MLPPPVPSERHPQFTVSSGKLYKWNIDGLSEQEIQNKIQHITMVANNYLNDGIPNTEVVELIVLGFTGKLLHWWNNCMTATSKEDIKHAVQKDEDIHTTNFQLPTAPLSTYNSSIPLLLFHFMLHEL